MTTAAQQLADSYVTMLNAHAPDLVDQFVAEEYINHNPFVAAVLVERHHLRRCDDHV
jgi:predicted SnoaL-like aldol condensation-catalyzing enzyme